jgi:Tol biopolymer transport system component
VALLSESGIHGQAPARAAQGQPAAAQPVIRQFTLYDRQGNRTATLGKPAVYNQPVFSPDGTRIAVILGGDVWIFDVAKGTGTQITSTPEAENAPVWLRDGTQIAYRATRGNVTAVYRNTTTGTPSEQRVAPIGLTLTDWSNESSSYRSFPHRPTRSAPGCRSTAT